MNKIIGFLISCFLLLACTTNDFAETGETVVEGETARLSIKLDQSRMITRSGMSTSQEQAVRSVFVLVFDSRDTKVSQTYLNSNINAGLSNIKTVSGNGMSVYVIANLSPQNTGVGTVSTALDGVNTVTQLNNVMLYNLAGDLSANKSLVMYGSITGQTIAPTVTKSVSIQMNYAASRVTLYIVTALTNPADSYVPADWTIQNYPTRSYLLQQPTDAVVPGTTSHFTNSATPIAWVDTTLIISGVSTPAKYAFIYMYDNRRGGRKAGSPSDTNQQNKAVYAPANASCITFRGYYKTASTNTVTGVNTVIHLGVNNYNDYNLQRGNDYSYTATIQGINNINVDSRVTSNTDGYQVSAFNTTMDTHPDSRPIQITSWPGVSTISILLADGVTPAPAGFWLNVSNINLSQAVNDRRVTYNPATDMSTSLSLTFPSTTPETMASQTAYLYAAENITTSQRQAVVKIVTSQSSTAQQTITVPISQLGYQTMGNVGFRSYINLGTINPADDYILAVENIEEASLNLTPAATPGTEATTTMQWGFNQSVAQPIVGVASNFYYRNGYQNTIWLVYNDLIGALSSVVRRPYGRISAGSASAASVTITENSMNPIFNTYPARYCFEKNRDLDGDGYITNPNTKGVNEINWYLPSADELYGIYVGQYALANTPTGINYLSSTELYANLTNVNSLNYSTGLSVPIGKWQAANVRCVRKTYRNQPQSNQNSPYVEFGTAIINNSGYAPSLLRSPHVACPVPMHSSNSAINNSFSPRFRVAIVDCPFNALLLAPFVMTWAQANGWTTVSDGSANAGVKASPATGCQAYFELGAPAGTWRLPTQREFYQILFMRDELVAIQGLYIPMLGSNYWTATNQGSAQAWCASLGSNTVATAAKTSLYNVRCVHDL